MPAVRYEFVAVGADQIKAHFRGITTEAQASARAAQQAQRATTQTTQATRMGANSAAASRAKDLAHVARIRDKHFADEQRAAEAAAKRTAASEARIYKAALKDRERAERAARQAREQGEITTQRSIERAQLRAQQERTRFRSDLGGAALRGVGGIAAGAGAAALGLTIAATRDAMRVQELANRVSINARKSGEAFIDPNVLRKEWERTAAATPGQTAEGIGGAVQSFIAMTGDIKTARKGQSVFATTASATGADVNDVARTAAALSMQFDIKGLEEMKDVLASLTFQGKEGAFELRDAAAYMQEMAAAGAAFGMDKGVGSVKTLGGLAQIAMTTSGGGAEASTAVQRMFTQLKMKTGVLSKEGIDVYRDGKTRDIKELLPEIIAKIGGTDIAKKQTGLQGVFDVLGYKAVSPLVTKYNAAYREATGTPEDRTKTAMAAVTAEINKATNAAGTWQDVVTDAARAQQDSSAKFTAVWEHFVAVVADEVLPALTPLVSDLTRFNGVLGSSITEFGLFLRGLRQTFEFLGLIKPQTPTEKLAESQQALKDFDAANEGLTDVPEWLQSPEATKKLEERAKLVANVKASEAGTQFTVGSGVKDFDDFNKRLKETGGIASTAGAADEAASFYRLATANPDEARRRLDAGEYKAFTPAGKAQALALTGQVDAAAGGATEAPEATGMTKFAEAADKTVSTLAGLTSPLGQLKTAIEAAAAANTANLLGGNGPVR